jgi:hypothetical protein
MSGIINEEKETKAKDKRASFFKFVEENENKWEHKQDTMETQLAEMAADKEIQAELRKINEEFSVTELDGNRIFMFPGKIVRPEPNPL